MNTLVCINCGEWLCDFELVGLKPEKVHMIGKCEDCIHSTSAIKNEIDYLLDQLNQQKQKRIYKKVLNH